MDLTGRTLLGKYRIEGLLGQGGMGSVWKGAHHVTGRKVAIKVLDPRFLSNVNVVQRFGREARAAARGQQIFTSTCAPCHGPQGKGNQAIGAPDLTDQLWLYAGDKDTVAATVRNGRGGVMPAWAHRLDPETIKELAIYVHSLGGGQ